MRVLRKWAFRSSQRGLWRRRCSDSPGGVCPALELISLADIQTWTLCGTKPPEGHVRVSGPCADVHASTVPRIDEKRSLHHRGALDLGCVAPMHRRCSAPIRVLRDDVPCIAKVPRFYSRGTGSSQAPAFQRSSTCLPRGQRTTGQPNHGFRSCSASSLAPATGERTGHARRLERKADWRAIGRPPWLSVSCWVLSMWVHRVDHPIRHRPHRTAAAWAAARPSTTRLARRRSMRRGQPCVDRCRCGAQPRALEPLW